MRGLVEKLVVVVTQLGALAVIVGGVNGLKW
jgi:hypothetical protein